MAYRGKYLKEQSETNPALVSYTSIEEKSGREGKGRRSVPKDSGDGSLEAGHTNRDLTDMAVKRLLFLSGQTQI